MKDLFTLKFPHELHGRAKEQAVLRQVYQHQYQHPPTQSTGTTSDDCSPRRRPWVSIVGPSGTGKTRLATRLAEQEQRQEQRDGSLIDDNGGTSSSSSSLFILGKFDFRRRNEPFVAFVHAFEQICARLLSSLDGGNGGDIATPPSSTVMDEETNTNKTDDDGNNDSNDVDSSDNGSGMRTSLSSTTATATTSQAARWRSLRERLRQELGEERQVLTFLIPSFSKVLQVDDGDVVHVKEEDEDEEDHDREDHSSIHSLDLQGEEIRNRFIFAVRRCIDIICGTFAPFVLVLDDLQWADAASLGLIKSLLTITSSSSSLENLMLIGCYRSNEVHEGHVLMTELLNQFDSMGVPHVRIDVENLSIETLGGYIAAVLSMEPSECRALTTVVHRKTMGNIFFVKQFLLSLFDDGLLRYNMGSTKWSWSDESELDAETAATENVVDLMQRRLINLPDPVSRMLQFLACLGSEFDMTLLQLVMEFLHRNDATVLAHTVDFAKICIDNGLIESVGTRFRFVHDRVQESAIDMLPDSDRLDLFFEFGQILSERDDLEERLFTTVDLLNQGVARDAQADSTQLATIAKLNLRAGKRAMGSAAFGAAASYLEKGIALLPADDLAIEPMFRRELYIAAAEAEFSEGNNDRARELCYDLLKEPDLDKDHSVRAQLVLVDAYTSEFKHAEATALCLKFLKEHGCVVKRPRDVFLIPAFLSSLAKTKSLMKGMTNDDFLHLPRIADPGKLAVMKLLDRLVSAVYFSDPAFLGLPILLLMRWTVKHGVCAQSCAALATYAYILAGPLGDLQAGFQFATLALDLVDRLDVREMKSKTIFLAHAFVIHRYQPVHLSLRPLELCYKVSMVPSA
jgi:predicted ATPase